MKPESEIIALPLEEAQKLWVELKTIPTSDKGYANARAIIDLIEATESWEVPSLEEVKARETVSVDGKVLQKDDVTKVYAWQYRALARYLRPGTAFAKRLDEARTADLEAQKAAAAKAPAPLQHPEITGAITEAITKGFEALKKATALIVFSLLLGLGLRAQAQTQSVSTGSPGQFQAVYIAGLNGGTNNIVAGTNTYSTNVISSIITNTVPVWAIGPNGQPTNNPTTTTTTNFNVPGLIFLGNWDQMQLHLGFNAGQGSGTNCTWRFNTSGDGINWKTNELVYTLAQSTTGFVLTNAYFTPGTVPPYICLNTVESPTGFLYASNIVTQISLPARRSGP